ncbi:MAG: hypothetical protein CMI18_09590 [Opitutaceae bacterium]|nr:hypothetical protein [Opitutaceae bacterium]
MDGLDIHFIHQRSKHENTLPLVITHGRPSSMIEFQDIIGPLTDLTAHEGSTNEAFHVICSSMPGFGFSDMLTTRGTAPTRLEKLWAN